MSDPTKMEMYRSIISAFKNMLKREGKAERKFDVESAIYWFCSDYHNGQTSNLYSALSTSKYRPGAYQNGVEDGSTAEMIYNHLVQNFGQ